MGSEAAGSGAAVAAVRRWQQCGGAVKRFSRLDGGVDVVQVNAEGDAHQHVLRSLDDGTVHLDQVGALESLEAEEVVVEVAIVHDRGIEPLAVLLDERFLRAVQRCTGAGLGAMAEGRRAERTQGQRAKGACQRGVSMQG